LSSKSTFSNSTSASYAVALYELSKENSEIDDVEIGMKNLQKILNISSDFKEMILSPTVTKEDKKNVIFAIADKNNFSRILKNFLGIVAIKNRLFFLGKIIESFLNLVSNNKGELKAKMITPKKLSTHEQENIQKELSKDFKSSLNIDFEHDPNLIAGLIMQVGSVMIDTSIKTKLKKLEKNMLEA
jgi:F-type H+-transporting ATPase subunit delta